MSRGKFSIHTVYLFFLCALFIGRGQAGAEWVEWIADGELLYSSQDNINNAINDPIKKSETAWTPSASFGRIFQATDFTRIIVKADVSAASHSEFTKLDYNSIGASVAARHKFGIGPARPWVRASLSVTTIDSKSSIRDGQQYIVALRAGKRLHDRVDFYVGYTYDKRNGPDSPPPADAWLLAPLQNKPGDVFDLTGNTLWAGINFLVTDRILLSAGYLSRSGDITAMCDATTAWWIADEITAATDDDAVSGYIYRANAKTTAYNTGLSYAFYGGHAALNISYEVKTSDVGGYSYKNNNLNVGLNYSY